MDICMMLFTAAKKNRLNNTPDPGRHQPRGTAPLRTGDGHVQNRIRRREKRWGNDRTGPWAERPRQRSKQESESMPT